MRFIISAQVTADMGESVINVKAYLFLKIFDHRTEIQCWKWKG